MANTKLPIELSSTPGIVDNSNATAITIDSSENVGIGTSSPAKDFVVSNSGAEGFEIDAGALTNLTEVLAYNRSTSAWNALRTGASQHEFYVSGTERMRIDASGNVGIGTSSPKGKLNTAFFSADNASSSDTTLANSFHQMGAGEYGTGRYFLTTYGYSTSQTNSGAYMGAVGMSGSGVGKYDLVFGTRNVTTDTAPTERMRIDTSGNLGLGVVPYTAPNAAYKTLQVGVSGALWSSTSSANTLLSNNTEFNANGSRYRLVAGAAAEFYIDNTGGFNFRTSPTSGAAGSLISDMTGKMILTASGNLLVGTTNSSARLTVSSPTSGVWTGNFVNTGTTGYGLFSELQTNNNTEKYFGGYSRDASNYTINIYTDGDIANTGGTYGTITSDVRVKENIVPATSKLDGMLALEVINFNLIGSDKKMLGFKAQQFRDIFPSLVGERDTRTYDDEGELTGGYEDQLNVRVGMEFAFVVKAMQEQQAIIDALTARLKALEGA